MDIEIAYTYTLDLRPLGTPSAPARVVRRVIYTGPEEMLDRLLPVTPPGPDGHERRALRRASQMEREMLALGLDAAVICEATVAEVVTPDVRVRRAELLARLKAERASRAEREAHAEAAVLRAEAAALRDALRTAVAALREADQRRCDHARPFAPVDAVVVEALDGSDVAAILALGRVIGDGVRRAAEPTWLCGPADHAGGRRAGV